MAGEELAVTNEAAAEAALRVAEEIRSISRLLRLLILMLKLVTMSPLASSSKHGSIPRVFLNCSLLLLIRHSIKLKPGTRSDSDRLEWTG